MKQTPWQYRITHLLTLITMVAVTFALFRWHVVAGFVSTPLLIGPAAGFVAMHDRAGVMVGLLSGVYWSIVAFMTMSFITMAAAPMIQWEVSPLAIGIGVYGLILVASLIGGYVGGRVAAAGVVIRA